MAGRKVRATGVAERGAISPLALELMDARAPHCDDLAALSRIAEILHLPDRLGSYITSEKQSRKKMQKVVK